MNEKSKKKKAIIGSVIKLLCMEGLMISSIFSMFREYNSTMILMILLNIGTIILSVVKGNIIKKGIYIEECLKDFCSISIPLSIFVIIHILNN